MSDVGASIASHAVPRSSPADLGVLRGYLSQLWEFASGRVAMLLLLTLASGFTESIGLLLLLPLLVVVGASEGSSSPLAETIESALGWIGVPLTLGGILLLYVALVSCRVLLTYWRTLTAAGLRFDFVDHQRTRLFRTVAEADWLFHVQRRASDISHVLTADINRIGTGTTLALDTVTRLIITGAYIAVALQLSFSVTALSLVVALLLGFIVWPQVGRSRELGAFQTNRGKRSFGAQAEFLSGLKLAKSFGNEDHHVEAYERDVAAVREASLGFTVVSARTSAAFQIGTVVSIALIVWFAVNVANEPAAELLALVAVVSRIAPAASAIVGRCQGAANMLPAFDAAEQLRTAARDATEHAAPATAADLTMVGDITLEAASFSYPAGGIVLDSIDVVFTTQTTTAIVGPSGAGKTTLGDVVLGLLEPTEGSVLIGGIPRRELDLASWRRLVGYVPQDPFLFHDTVRANIEWGAGGAISDADLWEVIDSAALGDLVQSLPDGVETIVGDRGYRLSGGERQRVALARALARKPLLLVLDEATSALDAENEKAIQASIEQLAGSLTVVVIAHRLSTIRAADSIVVMDAGAVVETGSWNDLATSDSRFNQMLGSQVVLGDER